MKTSIRAVIAAAMIGSVMAVQATEPATKNVDRTWTLATDDTELTLAVTDHAISIVGLRQSSSEMGVGSGSIPRALTRHRDWKGGADHGVGVS